MEHLLYVQKLNMETAEYWYNKTPPTYPEAESTFHSPELRIVLLGLSGVGKSATGNVILGRKAFKETRTRVSEIQRGRVEDRNISVIDTPGFFTTELTDEELQNEMMKSVSLCHPGPHVFLLIINLENMKQEERNLVKQIQKYFGPQAFKFTLVLFIGREQLSNKEWMVFMLSTKFQEVVRHCRDKYHAINSIREINPAHITKLLQKINEIIKQNDDQYYNNEIYLKPSTKIRKEKQKLEEEKEDRGQHRERDKTRASKTVRETFKCVIEKNIKQSISHVRRTEKTQVEEECVFQENMNAEARDSSSLVRSLRFSFERMTELNFQKVTERKMRRTGQWEQKNTQADLRIVMVGKTGAGKSATGNTILREKVFKEKLSFRSVTGKCSQCQRKVEGRIISVIDTPGLYDTSIGEQELKDEIVRCVEMSLPGPHVFLLVIRLDVRFTDEEKNTVKWIQENFGENAVHYTIILFTRGDQLKTSIEEFMTENKQVNELIKQCKAGYQVFNNAEENQAQVNNLLWKIDTMVKDNGGQHYTNQMYQEAQMKIWEEEERRREEDKRLRREEELTIRRDEQRRLVKTAKVGALVGASVGGMIGGAALAASTGMALPLIITGTAGTLAGAACVKVIAATNRSSAKKAANNK